VNICVSLKFILSGIKCNCAGQKWDSERRYALIFKSKFFVRYQIIKVVQYVNLFLLESDYTVNLSLVNY